MEQYKEKKALGLWRLVKTAQGLFIEKKRFDSETGEEVQPLFEKIPTLKEMQTEVAELNGQIEIIEYVITDAKEL